MAKSVEFYQSLSEEEQIGMDHFVEMCELAAEVEMKYDDVVLQDCRNLSEYLDAVIDSAKGLNEKTLGYYKDDSDMELEKFQIKHPDEMNFIDRYKNARDKCIVLYQKAFKT